MRTGLGIGLGLGVTGYGGGALVPGTPAITLTSTSADNTPDFDVDLPSGNGDYRDAAAGDHLIMEYQLQSGGSWSSYLNYTLSSGDIASDTISISSVSSVADGSYYFRARLERSALIGANSSSASVTISAINNLIWGSGNDLLWGSGNVINWG